MTEMSQQKNVSPTLVVQTAAVQLVAHPYAGGTSYSGGTSTADQLSIPGARQFIKLYVVVNNTITLTPCT